MFGVLAFVLICFAMVFNVLRESLAPMLFPAPAKVAFNKGFDLAKQNRAEGVRLMEAALADADNSKADASLRANLYYKYGCWNFNEKGLPNRFVKAKKAFARSLELTDNITSKAMTLGLMSDCDYYSGGVGDAVKNAEQALKYRDSGANNDPPSRLSTLGALGRAYMSAGLYDKAVKNYADAMPLARQSDQQLPGSYADNCAQLACAYALSGDRKNGDAQFVEAIAYADAHGDIGNRDSEDAIVGYTRALQKTGDSESAQKLITRLDNPRELESHDPHWTAIGW